MRAFLLLALATLSACASTGRPEAVRPVAETIRLNGGTAGSLTLNPTSTTADNTVPYPIEKVWQVLPTILDSLGITISVLDPAEHQTGNGGFKVRRQLAGVPLSRYFNCGEAQIGPNADSYDVYLVALAKLSPGPDGTTIITTEMDASARPISFSQAFSRCTTKGELESRILAAVKRRLER